MKRREFLQNSMLTLGSALLPSFLWPLAEAQVAAAKNMVFIFLRGGADALSLVQPTGAALTAVHGWRPNIKISSPLVLSPTLTLHPGFAALMNDPAAKANLNVLVNAGSLHESRSHFEQQALIESGNSIRSLNDGFLARASQFKNQRAVGVSTRMPASLRGALGQAILLHDPVQLSADYSRTNLKGGLSRAQRMGQYKNASGEVGDTLIHHYASIAHSQYDYLATLFPAGTTSESLVLGGGYSINRKQPKTLLAARLAISAALIGSDAAPGFLCIDAEQGWDTHHNQNPNTNLKYGAFGWKVEDLAMNLAAFRKDLIKRRKWANTVVIVMSEFGRTVKENGSTGTDHGRGGVVLMMGGNIRPHSDPLYRGPRTLTLPTGTVDSSTALPVLYDHRLVLAEVLEKHMAIPRANVVGASGLFYGQVAPANYLNVLKA